MLPAILPSYLPPCACAVSSITHSPCLSAISMIAPMSHMQPYRCTHTIALVLAEILSSIEFGSIVCVVFSTSAKTGTAIDWAIDIDDAMKV